MPPATQEVTVKNYHDTEIDVEIVEQLSGGRVRLDVEHPDGRRWRLEVKSTGELDEVLTTWRDGTLADIEVPEWMEDLLLRLQRA